MEARSRLRCPGPSLRYVESLDNRRTWVLPPLTGTFDDVDLEFVDPADDDDRWVLVAAEHPEFHAAVDAGEREIMVDGQVINPALHLTLHEAVAKQIWDDDPPEVGLAAQRLTALGYDRHAVLHMLMSAISDEAWHALRGEDVDERTFSARLAALPRS